MAVAGEPSSETPSPAVAPPPGSPRFPLMDSLRGLAVLAVLTFHVAEISGGLNRPVIGDVLPVAGNQALMLFFAMSAFLLYRPFAAARGAGRRAPNVARYARRRVLRIVPGYWTAVTVLAIFPGIVGPFSDQWWRYYGFLQGFSSRTALRGIAPAWSLSVEVSFYIAMPVWALCLRRLGGQGPQWWRRELGMLAAVALGGIVVQVLSARLIFPSVLATTLAGECTWLALGMALAVISVVSEREPTRFAAVRWLGDHPDLSWLGALACLLGAAAVLRARDLVNIIISLQTPQPVARTLGAIVLYAGCCVLAIAPAVFGGPVGGRARRVLAWRPLLHLGVVSYGVYLYHVPIAELIGETSDPTQIRVRGIGLAVHDAHLRTVALWVATVALSVLVATISYRIVELPMLRLKEPARRPRPR